MVFERGAVNALLRRPLLALEALRAVWAMRRRRGIRISKQYLRWRAATAYGDSKVTLSAQDLLNYLSWRRGMRRIRNWEREA